MSSRTYVTIHGRSPAEYVLANVQLFDGHAKHILLAIDRE